MLIDSGSEIDLASEALARRLPVSRGSLVASREILSITGERHEITEFMELTIEVPAERPVRICEKFFIAPISVDLIIGCKTSLHHGLLALPGVMEAHEADSDTDAASDENLECRMTQLAEVQPEMHEGITFLLHKFSEVFESIHPEGADVKPFDIKIRDGSRLPASTPRRSSPAMQQIIREEVKTLLDLGIIRPSESEISSPTVLIKYEDGR